MSDEELPPNEPPYVRIQSNMGSELLSLKVGEA